ncbi:MAG: hypothetical protein GY904_17400 [Planctomycetaceae bacterium]|nr:hypothetical protein [Planctomycetaceae bacterium]
MRLLISTALAVCVSSITVAHHPDKENQKVHPRIEVIPPLGNALPMSHRRKYNRPSNWLGKIAYHIAPSSQEAMAWHNATHRGYYKNKSPRIVTHYFYPKPWEGLRIGPRRPTTEENSLPTTLDVPTLNVHSLEDTTETIPSPDAAVVPEEPATNEEAATGAENAAETVTEAAETVDRNKSEAVDADQSEAGTTASPSDLTPPNADNDLPNAGDSAAEGINPPLSNDTATAE